MNLEDIANTVHAEMDNEVKTLGGAMRTEFLRRCLDRVAAVQEQHTGAEPAALPVQYYKLDNKGITYAVHGVSSIVFVEKLLKKLSALRKYKALYEETVTKLEAAKTQQTVFDLERISETPESATRLREMHREYQRSSEHNRFSRTSL